MLSWTSRTTTPSLMARHPRNAWTLISADSHDPPKEDKGTSELTLMCLEERELDQLALHQRTGELPRE